MNNISNIQDCYGCGVCATVCGRKIIEIRLDDDGFYEPRINDLAKCTGCGLCLDVCSYSQDDLALTDSCIRSYGAWSNDHAVRRKCSSGGVGFELGRYLIENGYQVCGVRYNVEGERAEHYIATTIEELIPSIGSKYIQSYTVNGYREIDRQGKYLVTGTPCQIDSFRRYLKRFKREDNFVLMDFFCHGAPSMLAWRKYVKWVEYKTGKITYASWRNKQAGQYDSWATAIDGEQTGEKVNWHDSYNMLIRGERNYHTNRLSQGDMFYKLFLSDSCLGKACYERCKFKYKASSADIRIGDAWGSHYKDNEDGVSAAIAFTEKGYALLRECNLTLEELSFDVVAEGQMKTCSKKSGLHDKVMKSLRREATPLSDAIKIIQNYSKMNRWKNRLLHPFRTIRNLIKKSVC